MSRSKSFTYMLSRVIKKLRFSSISGCQIHPTSVIESGSQVVNTVMDRHSFCGYDCTILQCRIGAFCSIADNVYIGGSKHPMHFASTSPCFLSHKDSVKTKFAKHDYYELPQTIIGADVWIGHGAKIKAGITIGHGAVIGMGAIVTKDVPPYAIAGGNPSKIIKFRFEKELRDKLLKSKWWLLEDEALRALGPYIPNPEQFSQKAILK